MVGVHLPPGDGLGPVQGCVEREHLRTGQQQEVVTLEEFFHGAVPIAAVDRGLVDVRRTEAKAAFHFPDGLRLELRTARRIGVGLGQTAGHQPLAVHQPAAPQAIQVVLRQAGLDLAAKFAEVRQCAFAKAQQADFHGQVTAQVAEPANARTGEVALQRADQVGRAG
ncbi:hypothetical protein D9M68_537960 [compost metagenome]